MLLCWAIDHFSVRPKFESLPDSQFCLLPSDFCLFFLGGDLTGGQFRLLIAALLLSFPYRPIFCLA